jgi:L-2,4-diaminobutyrate decarboxylase
MRDILGWLEEDASAEAAGLFGAIAAEYLEETRRREGRVTTIRSAEELYARFDEDVPREGQPLASIARRISEEILPDCIRLAHPRCVGHQVSPPLAAAIWADTVTSALNQSVAVREMSPALTALETRVMRWFCEMAGLPPGSGGVLTSGGTEATFTALLAARNRALPESWHSGVGESRAAIVCGEHAHYSTTRAAGELGLGMRSVVTVGSREYRMDVRALASTLDRLALNGTTVIAVVATAGSTSTGSFDDLETIADLCEARGLWLHVDGAHGATALLSDSHRARVSAMHRARSISWDAHKMMLLPLPAGMLLMRDEKDLERAFSQDAPYLFHGVGADDRQWDQGLRSFQCSRRADVLKVWVALQRYGTSGIGAIYDHLCSTTRTFHEVLSTAGDFEPMHAPESNILCFRWTGDGSLSAEELDAANLGLRQRLNASGAGWITTTTLEGRRVLRITVMNPRTTAEDLVGILDALRGLAS